MGRIMLVPILQREEGNAAFVISKGKGAVEATCLLKRHTGQTDIVQHYLLILADPPKGIGLGMQAQMIGPTMP